MWENIIREKSRVSFHVFACKLIVFWAILKLDNEQTSWEDYNFAPEHEIDLIIVSNPLVPAS